MDIREFDAWLTEEYWPKAACPECRTGGLRLDGTPVHSIDPESERLVNLYHRNQGPPEELKGTFHGQLICDNARCHRKVTIAGDWQLIFNDEDPWNDQFKARFRVRYANPPLRIMELPTSTPQTVVRAVESAATVIWASPASAANRLRFAVEQLLTARKIKRYNRAKGKALRPIVLHARIHDFRATHPGVADALEAVKWIGNGGSHDDNLTATDVLDGAEILELAVRGLYDRSEAELMSRVRSINKRRGLPKKKT